MVRWERGGRRRFEDRRGGTFRGGFGRNGSPIPLPVGRGGGFVTVLVLVAVLLLGGAELLPGLVGGGAQGQGFDAPAAGSSEDEELVDFLLFAFNDAQDLFASRVQGPWQDAIFVAFDEATETGCGVGSAQTGPFYCPADNRVYFDLGFLRALQRELGARGDLAQAYIVAHEVGHHLQNVVGTSDAVRRAQRVDPGAANELSVRLELQADCYAGVWIRSIDDALEPGDLDEAIGAAAAVGDDRIQRRTRGRIDPESFTHGTSEQRVQWLRTGYDTGRLEACDPFADAS